MFELLASCFDIEKFGDHEVSLFKRPVKVPDGPYVSKKPTDFIHVCRVLRWDPALHVVYMQRDPRDVIVSQHGSSPGRYWCDFGLWQRNQDLLPRLAGHPRFFICKYEELATEPDQVQTALEWRFAFLRRLNTFSKFDEVSQSSQAAQLALKGVREISAASVGKWRDNLPRVAAQFQKFPRMPDDLVATGYEPDRSWLSALDGVAPDTSESVRAELDELRGKSPPVRVLHRLGRRFSTLRDELRYICGYSKA
jgi:hypothetical protein